jgi:hypothetical protein
MLLHPLMLAWIGGAAVPLVVHLLSRSRFRAVEWGAMMFLTGDDPGHHHSARIKQFTLLLLRMTTVGLLAVALARPVISPRYAAVPTAGLTTGGSAAVVIVLDDSAGMGYTANGKSRLDLAREVTLQILSALKRGDQASLLLAGSREYQTPGPPSADLQSIASRVANLEPDTTQPDFAYDLNRAADVLDHTGPVDREIYMICDHQAAPWQKVTDDFKTKWIARKAGGPLPRVTVLPVGGDESDNVAVESMDFADRPVLREEPAMLQVRIHNYGYTTATDVPVKVWTGTRSIKDAAITVPARSVRSLNIPFRFNEPGSKVISAAVNSTGLTSDDRLDYAVDVLDHLSVLIVNSELSAGTTIPTSQPLSPLRAALTLVDRKGNDAYAVSTISADALTADAMKKTDVVILDDLRRLTPTQAKAVQQFADAGGGVLIFPGSDTRPGEMNAVLHGNGINVLPAQLKPPVSKPTRISSFDHQHPIFRFLPAKGDPFATTPFTKYFPSVPWSGDSHVLAKFATGEPFAVESNIGHGHAVLLTAALDPQWNSLMQSIVKYLGVNAAVDRNLFPGQPIVAITDESVDDRSATVQSMTAGTREPATIARDGDRTVIRYPKTTRPGDYRLHYKTAGKEKVLNFVVNPGHAGSDLTPLTSEQWKTLENRGSFNRVNLAKTTVAAAVDNQRGGREIWIDLLGGVLGLMTLEMLLSRWWSCG